MSAFAMSLLSPVLRRIICGEFKESIERTINLDDVDEELFVELMWFGFGEGIPDNLHLETFLQLAELSERLQVTEVTAILEDRLVGKLNTETCVEILARNEANGLTRLQEACYVMAQNKFQELPQTDAFLRLGEETMERLLEEDRLGIFREEDIFEAVVKWMTRNGREGKMRGNGLLRKIRFGAIGEGFLAECNNAIPGLCDLKQLVGEAMSKKGTLLEGWTWDCVTRLCGAWATPRTGVLGLGVLKAPRNVTIGRQGEIHVSDEGLNQVIVFSPDGSVVRRLQRRRGDGAGRLWDPRGIAVDHHGTSFVADRGDNQVHVFDAEGQWLRCFGSGGSEVDQLSSPSGVAIDTAGHILVADRWNNRIQAFNLDGSVAFSFGSVGTDVGKLQVPADVMVDAAGRIAVADSGNHRVQVFNSDGSVALCFGSIGSGPGQLSYPTGLTVDRQGRFIIADRDNGRVQVFNADGSLARVIGREGSALGEFNYPWTAAVMADGRILVADRCNNRMQVLW